MAFRGWYVQASMELGPEDVSLLERCPHFRGCFSFQNGRLHTWHTMQEAMYLCNRAVSEKSTQIFGPSLPVEYVLSFSGQTDTPDVRSQLTDTHTHTQT